MKPANYNPRERLPKSGELVLFKVDGDCLWIGRFDGKAFVSDLSGVGYSPSLVKHWRRAIATDRGSLSLCQLPAPCSP